MPSSSMDFESSSTRFHTKSHTSSSSSSTSIPRWLSILRRNIPFPELSEPEQAIVCTFLSGFTYISSDKDNPRFPHLIAQLLKISSYERYSAASVIFRENSLNENIYFLLSGEVSTHTAAPPLTAEELALKLSKKLITPQCEEENLFKTYSTPGACFGQLSSRFKRWTATVSQCGPVEVLRVRQYDFNKIFAGLTQTVNLLLPQLEMLFEGEPVNKLLDLAYAFEDEPSSFMRAQQVYNKSDSIHKLYFVKQGSFVILQPAQSNEQSSIDLQRSFSSSTRQASSLSPQKITRSNAMDKCLSTLAFNEFFGYDSIQKQHPPQLVMEGDIVRPYTIVLGKQKYSAKAAANRSQLMSVDIKILRRVHFFSHLFTLLASLGASKQRFYMKRLAEIPAAIEERQPLPPPPPSLPLERTSNPLKHRSQSMPDIEELAERAPSPLRKQLIPLHPKPTSSPRQSSLRKATSMLVDKESGLQLSPARRTTAASQTQIIKSINWLDQQSFGKLDSAIDQQQQLDENKPSNDEGQEGIRMSSLQLSTFLVTDSPGQMNEESFKSPFIARKLSSSSTGIYKKSSAEKSIQLSRLQSSLNESIAFKPNKQLHFFSYQPKMPHPPINSSNSTLPLVHEQQSMNNSSSLPREMESLSKKGKSNALMNSMNRMNTHSRKLESINKLITMKEEIFFFQSSDYMNAEVRRPIPSKQSLPKTVSLVACGMPTFEESEELMRDKIAKAILARIPAPITHFVSKVPTKETTTDAQRRQQVATSSPDKDNFSRKDSTSDRYLPLYKDGEQNLRLSQDNPPRKQSSSSIYDDRQLPATDDNEKKSSHNTITSNEVFSPMRVSGNSLEEGGGSNSTRKLDLVGGYRERRMLANQLRQRFSPQKSRRQETGEDHNEVSQQYDNNGICPSLLHALGSIVLPLMKQRESKDSWNEQQQLSSLKKKSNLRRSINKKLHGAAETAANQLSQHRIRASEVDQSQQENLLSVVNSRHQSPMRGSSINGTFKAHDELSELRVPPVKPFFRKSSSMDDCYQAIVRVGNSDHQKAFFNTYRQQQMQQQQQMGTTSMQDFSVQDDFSQIKKRKLSTTENRESQL